MAEIRSINERPTLHSVIIVDRGGHPCVCIASAVEGDEAEERIIFLLDAFRKALQTAINEAKVRGALDDLLNSFSEELSKIAEDDDPEEEDEEQEADAVPHSGAHANR